MREKEKEKKEEKEKEEIKERKKIRERKTYTMPEQNSASSTGKIPVLWAPHPHLLMWSKLGFVLFFRGT